MFFRFSIGKKCKKEYLTSQRERRMNIVTIEEQTFKQCAGFSGFISQVERICKENIRQPDKWLSGRKKCALSLVSASEVCRTIGIVASRVILNR